MALMSSERQAAGALTAGPHDREPGGDGPGSAICRTVPSTDCGPRSTPPPGGRSSNGRTTWARADAPRLR